MKIKSLLFAFFLAFLIWAAFPAVFAWLGLFMGLPTIKSFFLQLLGTALISLVCIHDLYVFRIFNRRGEGTPIPIQPSRKVITTGIYSKTRNPMYIGHMLIALGEFLIFGHAGILIYMLLLAILLHALVIWWEEPGLKKRLGKQYEEYLKKVPRWV